MTLSDIASVSTAFSGIAVTASVIYLAIQTRLAAKHARAQIHQGAAARVTTLITGLIDATSCAAWIEGNGGAATPSAIRDRQFALQCAMTINALEDLYLQNRNGLTDPEHFRLECETFRRLLSLPGMGAFWTGNKSNIARVAPGFCAFVDNLVAGATTALTHAGR